MVYFKFELGWGRNEKKSSSQIDNSSLRGWEFVNSEVKKAKAQLSHGNSFMEQVFEVGRVQFHRNDRRQPSGIPALVGRKQCESQYHLCIYESIEGVVSSCDGA